MVKHIHQYHRKNLTRNPNKKPYFVFSCIHCHHYIATHLSFGKETRCNRCGDIFKLDKITMQLSRPHCQSCIKHKTDVNELEDFLNNV